MFKENRVKTALADRGKAIGAFVQSPNPDAVETLGYLGYDFVIIDMEHGAFGFDTAIGLIRAAEAADISPIVRVAKLDSVLIGQVLDAGAKGVVVPRIKTREDAETAVAAAHYTRSGQRGACPLTRAGSHYTTDWLSYSHRADETNIVWLIVETREAVDNFDSIVSIPGLDGIVIGPFDLAHAMGHSGEIEHEEVQQALKSVVRTASNAGLESVAVGFSPTMEGAMEELQKWADEGSRVLVPSIDRATLSVGFSNMMTVADNVRTTR